MEPQCGNCGKSGHNYHQCKMPIISMGIVAFKYLPLVDSDSNSATMDRLRFLMIRRKDTLGFMDFMRGKYSIYNKEYLLNLLNEMTIYEKKDLIERGFSELWSRLWCNQSDGSIHKCTQEENLSRDKFETLTSGVMTQTGNYSLASLVQESNEMFQWEEAEWGFPKGRRNYNEKDIDCALREFVEETGYFCNKIIENLQPFEEIFMGSNFKSYKHKYYLMKIDREDSRGTYDKSEVSKIEWKTYDECMNSIRCYNLEKKRVIQDIYNCLTNYVLIN